MASGITIDTKDFDEKIGGVIKGMNDRARKGILDVSYEIIRLSSFEVPHDTGLLAGSGKVEPGNLADEQIVGYNKTYAAHLHEHPEYRFQKGRKGKYLEDPIKNNLAVLLQYIEEAMRI